MIRTIRSRISMSMRNYQLFNWIKKKINCNKMKNWKCTKKNFYGIFNLRKRYSLVLLFFPLNTLWIICPKFTKRRIATEMRVLKRRNAWGAQTPKPDGIHKFNFSLFIFFLILLLKIKIICFHLKFAGY